MKKLLVILMLSLLGVSYLSSLGVEIVTDEAGRTVWIISDLSHVFETREFPQVLFGFNRETFSTTVQAITEYDILQEDFKALDEAYDIQTGKLVLANSNIKSANRIIDGLEHRVRTQRWLTIGFGGLAVLTATAGAIGWALYFKERK